MKTEKFKLKGADLTARLVARLAPLSPPQSGAVFSPFGLKRKGLTFIELVVALGIISVMMSAAYMSYLYFFHQTAQLAALQQIGTRVLQQMQNCGEEAVLNTGEEKLLPQGTWKGCNTKTRLNLEHCEECGDPTVYRKTGKGDRICMVITKGDMQQCVGYHAGGFGNRFKITINQKVCVDHRNVTSNACTSDSDCTAPKTCLTSEGKCANPNSRSAVWPYVPCETKADCASPLLCQQTSAACNSEGVCT